MHSIRLYHMRYTGSKRARGPTPPHLHKLQTKLGGQRGPAAKIGPLTRHLPRRVGATPSPLAWELYSQLASPGVAQRRPDNDAAAGTPRQLPYCFFFKKKIIFQGSTSDYYKAPGNSRYIHPASTRSTGAQRWAQGRAEPTRKPGSQPLNRRWCPTSPLDKVTAWHCSSRYRAAQW